MNNIFIDFVLLKRQKFYVNYDYFYYTSNTYLYFCASMRVFGINTYIFNMAAGDVCMSQFYAFQTYNNVKA